MIIGVALFGVLITGIGLLGVVWPQDLVTFVERIWRSPRALFWAISFRIIFGLTLIFAAADCRFPATIRILGFIVLGAALGMVALGPRRFERLVAWWVNCSRPALRCWAGVAGLFGLFLLYAAT